MSIALVILIFVCITNITLGLLVLLRNHRSVLGRSFFAVSFLLSAWAVTNFLTEQAPRLSQNIFFNRLAYVTGLLSMAAMLTFSYLLAKKPLPNKNDRFAFILVLLAMCLFSYSDLAAGRVERNDEGLIFYVGQYIIVWTAFVMVMLIYTIRNFRFILKHGNPRDKNQAKIIASGIIATVILGSFLNVVLPSLTADGGVASFDTAKFGPLLTITIVVTTAYSIIKHGLFDIRSAFTKSIAYLFSLFVLVLFYFCLLVLVIIPIFHATALTASEIWYVIVFSIFSSIVFLPLKRFFDRISRRVFYREAYDLSDAIEQITARLNGVTDLDSVLRISTETISETFNSDYTIIQINRNDEPYRKYRYGRKISDDINELLSDERFFVSSKAVFTDWQSDHSIHDTLSSLQIGAVQKLDLQDGYSAILILGLKKHGGIYNSIDKSFLDIAISSVSLAVENALKYEEIQSFAETLEKRIATATRELAQSNDELKRLNALQNDFISATSHQLRPQLASALGFLELLTSNNEGGLSERSRKDIQKVKKSLDRMVRIVSGILEPTLRGETTIPLRLKKLNFERLVKNEMRSLKKKADKKSIKLILTTTGFTNVNILADADKIVEVVFNLIDNAVTYSAERSSVKLVLLMLDDAVVLKVFDEAPKIPPNEREKIFEKYYRSGLAKKLRPDGTGVGLYISRLFTSAHHGNIMVDTHAKGNCFTLWLPKNQPPVD